MCFEPMPIATWHLHPGYLDGAADLSEGKIVGKNWDRYRFAFADRAEHIFALTHGGRLDVFRHLGSVDGTGMCDPSRVRLAGGIVVSDKPDLKPRWLEMLRGNEKAEPEGPVNPARTVPVGRRWVGPVPTAEGYNRVTYAFALAWIQPRGPR